jgi:hypothetical protein
MLHGHQLQMVERLGQMARQAQQVWKVQPERLVSELQAQLVLKEPQELQVLLV